MPDIGLGHYWRGMLRRKRMKLVQLIVYGIYVSQLKRAQIEASVESIAERYKATSRILPKVESIVGAPY